MLVLILVFVFLIIVASTWWFGLWSNIITLCNFLIAALAAFGLREIVNDLFQFADPTLAKFGNILSVWGVFILVTGILRSVTDTLSSIRLRFHPAMEVVGRIFACLTLATGFILFAAATIPYLDFRTPGQIQRGQVNSLVASYETMGLDAWHHLANYWQSGPFQF